MTNAKNTNVFINPNAETESYQRPSHLDFATSAELRVLKFSGIRANSITEEMEIWLLGDLRWRKSRSECHANPLLLPEAHAEIFKLG